MKKIILLFLTICYTGLLFSQDLIVTQENDSIACKITQISSDNIYFSFFLGDDIKKNVLSKEMVKSYHYGYYTKKNVNTKIKPVQESDFSTYRIAIQGGFSYLFEKIDPTFPYLIDFQKKLKKGFNATASLSYYFTPYMGVGLNGSFFSSKATINDFPEISKDGTVVGWFNVTEKIKFYYIAPHFAGRLPVMKDKGALIMNASLGFAYYHDRVMLSSTMLEVKKPTVAAGIDIGYDFNIGESFGLGVMTSFLICYFNLDGFSLQNTSISLGENGYKVNMSRIDLTIGLRFR